MKHNKEHFQNWNEFSSRLPKTRVSNEYFCNLDEKTKTKPLEGLRRVFVQEHFMYASTNLFEFVFLFENYNLKKKLNFNFGKNTLHKFNLVVFYKNIHSTLIWNSSLRWHLHFSVDNFRPHLKFLLLPCIVLTEETSFLRFVCIECELVRLCVCAFVCVCESVCLCNARERVRERAWKRSNL